MGKKYIAFIELEKELKNDVLGVVFPDFPGCISCGDDYDEAFRNAHEALALHISGLKEDGIDIPEPRTLDAIEQEWEDYGDWEDIRSAVSYINDDGNVMMPITFFQTEKSLETEGVTVY